MKPTVTAPPTITFHGLISSGALQQNHLVDPAICAFGGRLYEPFGFQESFLRDFSFQHPRRIATVTKRAGRLELVSGFQFLNRVGYFISNVDLPAMDGLLVSWPNEGETALAA